MINSVNNRSLQLIRDKETIAILIAKSRYHKNIAIERRAGADARMQERARCALRFVLR